MGLPITRKMNSAEGVGGGQTATVKCQISNTFQNFMVTYTGVTLAQMKEVRLVINGDVERRWIGADEIDRINQFEGRSAANGVLIIDTERFHQRLRQGREITAIGTGLTSNDPRNANYKVNTMYLEIDIDAAASNPVLKVKANQREPRLAGLILKRRVTHHSVGAAGKYEISDLHQAGEEITRIFFNSKKIGNVEIMRNNATVFERTRKENEKIQIDEGLNPSALNDTGTGNNFYCYFPGESGYLDDTLVTAGVNDLRFYLDMEGADDFTIAVESIGALSNY